jgi:hypothetical protein
MIPFLVITFVVGLLLIWFTKIATVYVSFILLKRINNNLLNKRGLKRLLGYWKVINW